MSHYLFIPASLIHLFVRWVQAEKQDEPLDLLLLLSTGGNCLEMSVFQWKHFTITFMVLPFSTNLSSFYLKKIVRSRGRKMITHTQKILTTTTMISRRQTMMAGSSDGRPGRTAYGVGRLRGRRNARWRSQLRVSITHTWVRRHVMRSTLAFGHRCARECTCTTPPSPSPLTPSPLTPSSIPRLLFLLLRWKGKVVRVGFVSERYKHEEVFGPFLNPVAIKETEIVAR